MIRRLIWMLLRRRRTSLHVLAAYVAGAIVGANTDLTFAAIAILGTTWGVLNIALDKVARWWSHHEVRRVFGPERYESVKEYLS